MILEGEFFSGGHLRWNLGWPTPNYAGAFLATVLALAFAFSTSRWRWAVLVAEAVGLFLLAKTYSRGAVVACCMAWGFGFLAACGWKDPAARVVWAARVAVLAVLMFAVGFGWSRTAESVEQNRGAAASADAKLWGDKSDGPTGRITTRFKQSGEPSVTEDGSVVNRLALWRGGLTMIAAAPLAGWGAGESGRGYMNWYQDLDRDEGYATMVNSYLHVGVEHGLPMLGVVFFGVAWLLTVAWWGARDEQYANHGALGTTRPTLMMAAGASLVAWATANVFTTLWIDPKLWVVPVCACLILVWATWGNHGIRFLPWAAGSLAVAVVVPAALYGAGRWLLRDEALSMAPGRNGSVVLESHGSVGAVWQAWPDPTVLGPTPGKEMRRWLAAGANDTRLIVHRATRLQPGEHVHGSDGVILFGRQAERLGRIFSPECREFWLIHPLGAPPQASLPQKSGESIIVVLPEIDETGNGPAWRNWAAKVGARIVVSDLVGLDIRTAWPEVMKGLGTNDKQ